MGRFMQLLRKLGGGPSEQAKKSNKWRFYVGLICSFVGLVFLFRFGIGPATWVPLGIGFGNLAIWFVVRLSFKQPDKFPETKKSSDDVDS